MSERMTVNNKTKGLKKHGFLSRLATKSGRSVIKRRILKGRKSI